MAGSTANRLKAPTTSETWFDGNLTICQPRDGYRYTIDPLILCTQAFPRPGDHLLDLGCGCGIMPLILGYRHPEIRITGVEIQTELADIAAGNVTTNGIQEQIRILNKDITRLTLQDIQSPADIIISNPPYKKRGTGRMNPHRGRAVARHEILVTIDQVFKAAAALLAPEGRLVLIFPAGRLEDLKSAAVASALFLKEIRFVHQSKTAPPCRVLVSAVKTRVLSPKVQSPLILHKKDGTPTKAHLGLINP